MARAAHVNLMTDTVIANLSPDALRAVVRALLADDRDGLLARRFQDHARQRLRRDCDRDRDLLSLPDADDPVAAVLLRRRRILALLGCGLAVDSLALIADIVTHAAALLLRRQHDRKNDDDDDESPLLDTLAAVDADLVQALTAVRTQQQQQQQHHPSDAQTMAALRDLQHCLAASHAAHRAQHCEFAFERGQDMLRDLLEAQGEEEKKKKKHGGTDGLSETI
ncbi:hypothetical protein LOZ07_006805 [Ophidiomyces ophidiicola]|uniref:Uncharacterized protein n=1 Tax=Ophidiomyces ophidiicola TaxID=1387563 RepID=A0ACB8UTG9_9EURO|nr:hypothetical protein LOZ64_000024 [Ophidiomyces ophidiicola]KAI1952536.1 hypothetical protein LOZ59_005343 [Ophidiomyces ophidiicola]KAI1969567.1 hypothetical protein LOZ56_004352 [Ophidiomyces ophidiicola]KAI2003848.1 hypothetical protein LOZ49_006098 [Ophidiomyces ophidiicola]KAI2020372.1 hypothetical protein LOZ48_006564 [Ophidiomyces ophidiicola]